MPTRKPLKLLVLSTMWHFLTMWQFLPVADTLAMDRYEDVSPSIQLMCSLTAQTGQDMPGFETEFCGALQSYLVSDLKIEFQLVTEIGPGQLVKVDVQMRSQSAAIVQIRSGYGQNGIFVVNSSDTTNLTSFDRPISSFSSRTLVRGVASQLGLIP